MSSLFFNKIAAAVLTSALGFIAINKFAGTVVPANATEDAAYAYSLAPAQAAVVTVAAPAAFPSPEWIAGQDPAKGAKVFKKCTSCHNATSSGKNGTGPALWNIIGRPVGAADGFGYSSNMAAKGGTWGYEELDAFLAKPKKYIPKTKMAFNGLKKETDRAAVIAFLRMQADTPLDALTTAPIAVVEEMAEVPMGGEQTQDITDDHTHDDNGGH